MRIGESKIKISENFYCFIESKIKYFKKLKIKSLISTCFASLFIVFLFLCKIYVRTNSVSLTQ